jgi:MICOS complex subunit MIC12
VTLTLGVAYLTILAHRRNREQQAAILRQQTYLLSGITDPLPPKLPPTRAELAAIERANLTEAAKDRWNAEVEHAVKWAQTKDWSGVREDLELAVSNLWARALGKAQEGAEIAEEEGAAAARDLTRKTKAEVREKTDSVAAAAKSAYADAKAKSASVATKAEEKAEVAKGSVLSAIGKGVEKGKEVLDKAKSAVISTEEKMEAATSKLSPVEKALQQRYEKPSGLNQTVEEALAARYVPIDQRDNTNLKTL